MEQDLEKTRDRLNKEKGELAVILASPLFSRAPSMVQFLTFVCQKYFDGISEQIKEYNIAVEALGRSPDFQQKEDPIVRVEANRLRKRLKQYYETEGHNHRIQLTIPVGQYVPVFEHMDGVQSREPQQNASLAIPEAPNSENPETPTTLAFSQSVTGALLQKLSPRMSNLWLILLSVLLVLLIVAGGWWSHKTNSTELVSPKGGNTENQAASITSPAEEGAIRIMAGSTLDRYVDRLGKNWVGDRYYQGGSAVSYPQMPIALTQDPEIYRTAREGEFTYEIPLRERIYELRLHFSENFYGQDTVEGGGESSRLVDVQANGQQLLTQFDILADAGGNKTADIKVFKDIVPQNGKLLLTFTGFKVKGIVSGIEIIPANRGQIRPIRILTRNAAYISRKQELWEADRFFRSGRQVPRNVPIQRSGDPELFLSERYGNFSYVLAVVPGRYTLNLYFAETYFGKNAILEGGPGSRLFNVFCNGEVLLRNFDLFKEAGGENRALIKRFRNIQPNAQDKIILSFVPLKNYANVCAIEVLPDEE
jgi:hypothetical protein